jgi:hypothetical protein
MLAFVWKFMKVDLAGCSASWLFRQYDEIIVVCDFG